MEQTRYWTWSRRKLNERPLSSQIPPISVASSWEEQAFAEDSAGHLGGCIWPPRSYSCSFCRREFRSAQALGGHMNVHRRDRARLKQSSIPSSEPLENGHYHHLTLCMPPIRTQYPSQVGPLVYNSNPKPNPNCDVVVSPLSPSKVSATSTQQSWTEHTLISPSYSSCVIREKPKESLFSTTRSPKNSIPLGLSAIPKLNLGRESLRSREVGCQAQRDLDDEEDEAISRKRGRTTDSTSFFVRPSSDDRQQVQPEVLKFNPKPVEELDLELRLGGPPRVK